MPDLTHLLSVARDQGVRNTCLSIALSDGHTVARGGGPLLSCEFLHHAAATRSGVGLNDPISLRAGRDALAGDGQPEEFACPYSPSPRPIGWSPPPNIGPIWRRKTLKTTQRIVRVVRSELQRGRATVLILRINDAFRDAVLSGNAIDDIGGPDRGLHAVLAVADSQTSGPVLIRNSWGLRWGDSGHAWLTERYLLARCTDVIGFSKVGA